MADIIEAETYEAGIYQLEITDPVLGGENGISNRQAKQLANRTKWLKAKVDLILGGTFEAAKAVVLKTARKINGIDFDGSANITLPTVNTSGDQEASGIKNFTDGIQSNGKFLTPFVGFKNHIIDGRFDFWYEGTSQTVTGYGSDTMWGNSHVGSTKTHSRQSFTVGEAFPDGVNTPQYFSRTVVASVAGAGSYVLKGQQIEDVTRLAGKTVTLSFYAKADSDKSIAIELSQFFGTGGSPSAVVYAIGSQKVALTTSWARYKITVNIPSVSGKTLGTDGIHTSYTRLAFWFDAGSDFNARTASLGQQSGTFDIALVQLEEGSVATEFQHNPIGIERLRVGRYYEHSYAEGVAIGSNTFVGCAVHRGTNAASNSGYATGSVYYSIQKRALPSLSFYNPVSGASGTWRTAGSLAADITINAPTGNERSFRFENVQPCDLLQGHWKADARL